MRKPKLKWEKSGRSFVAYAGRLRLTVAKTPARFVGGGSWRVRDVFGDQFVPSTFDTDFALMEVAAVAAETYARTALKAAAKALGRRR